MSFSKLLPVSLKSTLTPPSFSQTSLILKFKLLWSCSNFSQILSIWNKFLGVYPNPSQIFFYFSPIFSHTSLKSSYFSEFLQTSPCFLKLLSNPLLHLPDFLKPLSFGKKLLWVCPNFSQILSNFSLFSSYFSQILFLQTSTNFY